MHMDMINKYYFINKFDTNIINKQDKQTTIIYRNYDSKIIDKLLILKIAYCARSCSFSTSLFNGVGTRALPRPLFFVDK
mgnify:CR=1 FL=1